VGGGTQRYITLKEERQIQPSPKNKFFFFQNKKLHQIEKLVKTICVDEMSNFVDEKSIFVDEKSQFCG
jgi:hypothetical protein